MSAEYREMAGGLPRKHTAVGISVALCLAMLLCWHGIQKPPGGAWPRPLARLSQRPREAAAAAEGPPTCPDYFRHVSDDLAPWRPGGIRRAALNAALTLEPSFRLQMIGGQLYAQYFRGCYQTRALFTIWGFLKLLQRFPGELPDVDIVFHCDDWVKVEREAFARSEDPPIMLGSCSTPAHLDLVWPDWSFWGWFEMRIPEWETARASITAGARSSPWAARAPLAFWKGAVWVAPEVRQPLMDCGGEEGQHPWGVDARNMDWAAEGGLAGNRPENQCGHRYRMYAEGTTWSCSWKYILACNSTNIALKPRYFDIMSRGLKEGVHYLMVPAPPGNTNLCSSLKATIDAGNADTARAQAIAAAGARFTHEDLHMARVYDYMLHFLWEYARLQRFAPERGPDLQLVSQEGVLDTASSELRKYLVTDVTALSRRPRCRPGDSVEANSSAVSPKSEQKAH